MKRVVILALIYIVLFSVAMIINFDQVTLLKEFGMSFFTACLVIIYFEGGKIR